MDNKSIKIEVKLNEKQTGLDVVILHQVEGGLYIFSNAFYNVTVEERNDYLYIYIPCMIRDTAMPILVTSYFKNQIELVDLTEDKYPQYYKKTPEDLK